MKEKMICNVFLLISHKLTDDQKEELLAQNSISNIMYLPSNLQSMWSAVPTAAESRSIENHISIFIEYLLENTKEGDYIMIQGDFGLTYALTSWSLNHNRIPIYATTQRIAQENINPDGSKTLVHSFKHNGFRKYRS